MSTRAVAAARAVDAGHDVVGCAPGAEPDAGDPPDGQPWVLHDRGLDGRPARRLGPRDPVLRVGLLARGSRKTSSTTSWPSTRPAARRTPACAATSGSSSPRCSRRRSPSGSTPSRPGTTPSIVTGVRTVRVNCTASAAWAKDQSYVLGVLTAEQLAHAMFPLGATPSKDEVRAEAAARGLTGRAEARLATTSASSPTATPAAGSPTGSGPLR